MPPITLMMEPAFLKGQTHRKVSNIQVSIMMVEKTVSHNLSFSYGLLLSF